MEFYKLDESEIVTKNHYCGQIKENVHEAKPVTNELAIGLSAADCRKRFVGYEFYKNEPSPIFDKFNFLGSL